MTRPPDHLKQRYGDRYRVSKGEDGCWNLRTKHQSKDGTQFQVFDYSDSELAACLPPRTAWRLLKEHPETFTVTQDADDGVVLRFAEERLDELAEALKLRRRKQVSDAERERLREMSREHSPFLRNAFGESGQSAPDSTIGAPDAPVVASG